MGSSSIFTVLLISILILLIICVVLIIMVLNKNNKKEYEGLLVSQQQGQQKLEQMNESLQSAVRNEFSTSRMESAQRETQQRKEVSDSIGEMSAKLTAFTKDNHEANINMTEIISGKLTKLTAENYESNIKMSEMISGKLTEMRKSNEEKLNEMRFSNEAKLEQMRATVDEKLNETLSKRLDSSFKTVSDQLENVYKSLGEMKVLSTGVTENVTSLNRILTNVKARGTWAEVQLEGLLNQTIPGMFERNVMTNPTSKNIVEFAVKIPSSDDKEKITYLPIDSKFPVEDYIRLCNAADNGDTAGVESARKALESRIIAQAKDIHKYINEPATTPYAIMYLATEGLYSEAISSRNAVVERCQNEYSVMIAGPSTITALLNSLSMGFKAMAINEKAKEVRVLLSAAKAQYEKFGVVLDKARKKIDEAGRSLEDAQSRNTIIQKKLKGVEEIDKSDADDILGITDGDE